MNGENAASVAEELGGPDTAVAVTVDVTDEEQIAAAFRSAVLAFGGVDLVVNNAGISLSKPLLETTAEDWDLQHAVMARGSFLVSREAARLMTAQRLGGDIVYIASKNAVFAGPNNIAYSATKADQAHQVRLLAAELGEHGIRVNGVNRTVWCAVRGSSRAAGGSTGRRVRGARGEAGRVLCAADAAEAGGAAGACGERRVRADRRRPHPHHRAARPGRRRRRRRLPAVSGGAGAYAAVDLGASSGRVMVGRVGPGTLELTQAHRFPNRPVRVPEGLRWDVLGLYAGVLDGLRAAGAVDSVGIDSWAVDFGLLDADGALLGNPVHYRDGRTGTVAEKVWATVPARELYAATGLQYAPFNTLYQLVAARDARQFGLAERLLLMPDLLAYWLTGGAGHRADQRLHHAAGRPAHPHLGARDRRAAGDRPGAVRAAAVAGRTGGDATARRAGGDRAERPGAGDGGRVARHGVRGGRRAGGR